MTFVELQGTDYTQLLAARLRGELPELTWLKQFREILTPYIKPGTSMLDIGCATGYAYNSFKDSGVTYTGIDSEKEYLKLAQDWFVGSPNAKFIEHDILQSSAPAHDIVICSAVIAHCPSLMPTLKHIVDGAKERILLRAFFGEEEKIYTVPSKVSEFSKTHQLYVNQYSFQDVLGYLDSRGFTTRVYRDEFTDSLPKFMNNTVRSFYLIYGEAI